MSFGYSAGDLLGYSQLAWKVFQNSRRACGEHHGLTREVKSLHSALKRLEREASEAESSEASTMLSDSKDLKRAIRGCARLLRELDGILEKYSSLRERQLSIKKLWSKVVFGNSEVQELDRFRFKISTYLSIMMLHLNMSTGSEMRKMKVSIDSIASRMASGHEGSLLTSYDDDDKAAWKELRRELHQEGFEDSFIRENRRLIMIYVRELGDKGIFDKAELDATVDGPVGHDELANAPSESEPDEFSSAKNVVPGCDSNDKGLDEEESHSPSGRQSDVSNRTKGKEAAQNAILALVLSIQEEASLQSAIARIQHARDKGKLHVELTRDELEALEKRRNALMAREEVELQATIDRIRRQEQEENRVVANKDDVHALEMRLDALRQKKELDPLQSYDSIKQEEESVNNAQGARSPLQ
jgi:hypothetical protein